MATLDGIPGAGHGLILPVFCIRTRGKISSFSFFSTCSRSLLINYKVFLFNHFNEFLKS